MSKEVALAGLTLVGGAIIAAHPHAAMLGRLTTTSGANPIMRAIRSDAVEVESK